jgi:hypothetical protein
MTVTNVIQPQAVARARRKVRVAIRRVRCESRLVSRYLFNAVPVRNFRKAGPVLTGESRRVVDELRSTGVVMTTVPTLMGSPGLFEKMQARVAELRHDELANVDPSKPFLIELLGPQPAISPTDPIAEFALHPAVRGVAEAYSRMTLRIQDVNVWINKPTGEGPTQSQRWHRDLPEDHDIVKCFVYLSDVPIGAGPLQYIRATNTRAGRRLKFETEFDGIGYRIADDTIDRSFASEMIVTATGGAGSMVFTDTRGLHRGGFARDAERVVLQITYASNACCRPRNLLPAAGTSAAQLPDFRLASG